MNEIAKKEGGAIAAPAAFEPASIWSSFLDLARDPTIDAGKVSALVEMQERMQDRLAFQAFTVAKNTAMANMPRINKDQKIVHNGKLIGKFVKYEDLRRAIDPILTPLGLRITHESGFNDTAKAPTITAVLSFAKDGLAWTEKSGAMMIPLDSGGAKSGAQAAGSSLTYGQRYTTCAVLGIVVEAEDDDGNGGQKRGREQWQDVLLADGQMEAAKGTAAYAEWFKALSNMRKGWLVDEGHHENLKQAAANHD